MHQILHWKVTEGKRVIGLIPRLVGGVQSSLLGEKGSNNAARGLGRTKRLPLRLKAEFKPTRPSFSELRWEI